MATGRDVPPTPGYSWQEGAGPNQTHSALTSNLSRAAMHPPDEATPGTRDWLEYNVALTLLKWGLPAVILVGTVGNILALLVLMRRRMRCTSICFYLAMLAIADTCVLYLSAFKTWMRMVTGFEVLHVSGVVCKLTMFLLLVSLHMSAWLVVAMTVDRFVAVWLPLKVSKLCKVVKSRIVTAVLLLAMMLINLHALWTMNLQLFPHKRCASSPNDTFMTSVYPYIKLLSYCVIPFLIVLSLNVCIIYRLWQNRGVLQESRVSRRSQNRVTVMLLSVSFAWLALTAPFMLWSLVIPTSRDPHTQAKIFLFKTVCFLLMYTNHSINFFIYCITGKRFRQEIHDLFCGRGMRRRDTWNTCGRSSRILTSRFSSHISMTSLRSRKSQSNSSGKQMQRNA